MKLYLINGSPRKQWNTARLLEQAGEGAAQAGADYELVHLYEYQFQGCTSCFYCKRKDKPHGICAMRDGISPLLEELRNADGLVLGSPIYFGNLTGVMRSFLERFLFSNKLYNAVPDTVYPKQIRVGMIYTIGATPEVALERRYMDNLYDIQENWVPRILGPVKTLVSQNTWQFDDYSLYEADIFDICEKERVRKEQFPLDLQAARQLGAWVAEDV